MEREFGGYIVKSLYNSQEAIYIHVCKKPKKTHKPRSSSPNKFGSPNNRLTSGGWHFP